MEHLRPWDGLDRGGITEPESRPKMAPRSISVSRFSAGRLDAKANDLPGKDFSVHVLFLGAIGRADAIRRPSARPVASRNAIWTQN